MRSKARNYRTDKSVWICLLATLVLWVVSAGDQLAATEEDQLVGDVFAALERSTDFFRSIATEGGYLWRYAENSQERWGETKASETQIWVQPPGTPSVGMAFLRAYQVTQAPRYLDAAKDAADALAWGQLESGGWTYLVDFSPTPKRPVYRRAEQGSLSAEEQRGRRNWTTFDDDTTQSALRFLMAVTQLEDGPKDERDQPIQEALAYGLEGMLRAQYPNGAWPQGYDGREYDPAEHPLKQASVPEEWPREYPGHQNYWTFYTFNDNTIRDCILTMLEAYRRFARPEYLESVNKAGDFILRAQMPDPQPVWAQQYHFDMTPSWARKFEPPAVCTSESVGVLRTLLDLYLATGQEKYLESIPAAIEWFERSRIGDKGWARFYELSTNRPLYFTKDYRLVYTDTDLPTHYSFQGNYNVSKIQRDYQAIRASGREAYVEHHEPVPLTREQREERRRKLEPRVREALAALDEQGRWVVDGWIESRTFIRHINLLCDYLEVSQ